MNFTIDNNIDLNDYTAKSIKEYVVNLKNIDNVNQIINEARQKNKKPTTRKTTQKTTTTTTTTKKRRNS